MSAQCVAAKGTVEGIVFSDTDNNGIRSISETGITGIIVQAHNADGALIGNTTTGAGGYYAFSNLIDGEMIRLTFGFSGSFASSWMGKDNGSSVQFVQAPACSVGVGLVTDADFCNEKTEILTTCFVQGAPTARPDEPTIVGIEYGFNSATPARKFAMHGQTGSIWGLAWKNSTHEIFSSSFVKQYSGLKYGHDAIMKTAFNGSMYTTSLFAKLSLLGQESGDLTVTDITDCSYGDQVGKIGLGSIVISPDEKYLYVVNIYNNTLVRIQTSNPSAANTVSYKIPGSGAYAFALKYYNDKIYVGTTIPGDIALVYAFNPADASFVDTGLKIDAGADWNNNTIGGEPAYWLTDIDFSDNGDMLISLSDRLGHKYCNALTNRLDEQKGDLMIAFKDGNSWKLEDRSVNTEFFSDDFWVPNPAYHSEITVGGIYAMPGTSSVVATVFDPEINSYSGGLHRYNTVSGKKEGSKELYTRETVNLFGKASGFGDIISTCGLPEIEVGNLVWADNNANGIQDANEKGIADITMVIYDETCSQIGTTVTDQNGNYVFNSRNVPGGLVKSNTYYIGIDSKHSDPETGSYKIGELFYSLTKTQNNFSLIDSDPAGHLQQCTAGMISVNVPKTQHTFDIGLLPAGDCSLKVTKTIVNRNPVKREDIILFEIAVANRGTSVLSSVEITDKLPAGYLFVNELNPAWVNNNGTLTTTLTERLAPGQSISTVLSLNFDKKSKSLSYTNTASVTAASDAVGNVITNLSSCFDTVEDNIGIDFPPVCDLALIHKVNADIIYTPNSKITLVTTVCNQGNLEASSYQITNFLNKEFDFDPALNPGWKISADLSYLTFDEPKVLNANTCRDYNLNLTIKNIEGVTQIVNYAEISSGACSGIADGFDFDSTPDKDILNDKGGQPNTATDNMMDDKGDIDEDDHDPAIVYIQNIDVSLVKSVANRRVKPGQSVTFNLDLKNEGSVSLSSMKVVDYIPAKLILNDNRWTKVGSDAEMVLTFKDGLKPGETYSETITFIVDQNATAALLINAAEIVEFYDELTHNISFLDVDSTPDNIRDNDLNSNSKTEDDYDTADLIIGDINIDTQCLDNATNSNDGQCETVITLLGDRDDNWFIEQVVGFYDPNSPAPPALPLPYAAGFVLNELPAGPGLSQYSITGLHIDGLGFNLRIRNTYGDLEDINITSGCTYRDVLLTGPRSLCIGAQETYSVPFIAGTTYSWTLDGNAIGTNTNTVDIDWSTVGSGVHQLLVHLSANDQCFAPATATVAIGAPDFNAIACIGDFNVSLDGLCSMVVTPSMMAAGNLNPNSPYTVMLTDAHGNAIPNATLTSVHAGTKVMAKLIEGCGGNTCWSTITVEDKAGPVSLCQDIILPCYKLDEYKGPFETDNCGGPISNVIVSENITPLTCNAEYVKYIDRVYQATDKFGNKSKLCSMRISVERPDLDLLKFPRSFLMVHDSALICTDFAVDEDGHPATSVTGVPTLAGIPVYPSSAAVCNLYTGYSDTDLGYIGCTRKILRNWTVYENWCTYGETRTFIQVLEITDTIPPAITALPDVTVSTNGHHECEGFVTLPVPVVTDKCSNVYEVDVTYPGGFVKNIKTPQTITLPAGIHTITYTAYDRCLNSAQTSFEVTVADKTAPTVICKGEVIVGLNSNGEAYLYPQNIDDGSFDGCGLERMKVARMVQGGLIPDSLFKDFVDFKCVDAGRSVMVALRVWDVNGNSNSCMMTVTIQDKHAPKITCPDDLTIDCSEVFSGMDLNQYGKATAIDACGATVRELAPVFVLNSCRVGYIERTFVATDGQGSATCKQIITVENEDYFDPLTDVVKPLDYEVSDRCAQDQLLPENLPAQYGYPVITQSACGMAAASFDDAVYTFITGACYKIVRTWTIIDWCEMQRQGQNYVPYTFQQIIKVNNTVPPFFVGLVPDRDTFLTEKGNCTEGFVDLKVTGKDLCTPDNKLRWSYTIDYDNDGVTNYSNTGIGNMAAVSGLFPVGLHKIKWSFEDACGNVVTKEQLILVVNNDNPTAAALESISISINPWDTDNDGIADNEMACIKAWTLNTSSSSACCTSPLLYSFSADVLDTIRCFDCRDLGEDVTVQLWVHDCNGNTDFVNVNVEVQDNNNSDVCAKICEQHPVIATLTGNNIICDGSSTILTATGGVKYKWSTGETTSTITVSPSLTTTYTVTVTNEFKCTATPQRIVTVNAKPNVAIAGANICNGGSTTLTASGGTAYVWNTGATTAMINVSPATSTTYTVTATNANGCTASVSRLVVVSSLPIVNVTGTNIVCRNVSTTLTATGGSTYLWNNGATSAAITVTPLTTTTYTVTATNTSGCTASATRTVTVNQLPVVNVTGTNIICNGASTTLTASGGATYLWSNNATTAAITVNPVTSTTYTVTATDANGCTNTANRLVTVNQLPNVIISGDLNICVGESTVLTASGATTYLWNTGATTAAINVSPVSTTTYTVTATDANGCSRNTSATVTVNPPATAGISGLNAICSGTNTNLTASGGATYIWSTGATTSVINVAPLTTTTYTVTVTNANGCTGSTAKVLTVNPKPVAVISGDLAICLGETTTLTASGGVTYLWNTSATTAAINVTPAVNTTYTVTVTDANGCTGSTAATVTVDSGTLTCSTQNITVYLGPDGSVSIDPEDINTGSSGACANIQATVTPNQFFCNDILNNPVTVTLTVTNTNTGQTLSCTALVTVADTLNPTLTCPNNQSLKCDEYVPGTPLSTFGTATAVDNCNVGLVITELPIVNLNQCYVGQITRTFTATDNSGNTSQCVQIISVVNSNPVGLANISFPPDITITNCDGIDPVLTGNTTVNINNADCSDIVISYSDDAPLMMPLCQDTVNRTWTVIDSCQLVPGTNNGIFTKVQKIYVGVSQPIIVGPLDTILYADPITCVGNLGGNTHSALGCNLTLNNNYNNNNSFNIKGDYPLGTTTIVFTAQQQCNNTSTSLTFVIEVVDTLDVSFECIKTFPEINDNLIAIDHVDDHITILGNCEEQLNIIPSFSNMDINDTTRMYNCSNILLDFPVTIYFWLNGSVIDSCAQIVTPVDPNHFCPNTIVTVGGTIQTEIGQKVPGVEIKLEGSDMTPFISGKDGRYAFSDMNTGGNYNIVPFRNDHPLEGVSTLDLIYIQRHILKSELLNSPYKVIAADINGDEKVTASDIVQLRKVILGISEQFTNNTSWRLVDKGYIFPDPKDPFLTSFTEKYQINGLNSNMKVDWVGIKTGDVNNSYITNATDDNTERRSAGLYLQMTDKLLTAGEHLIPVTASTDVLINGFQLSMNVKGATSVALRSAKLAVEDYNYSFKNGLLYISWNDQHPIHVQAGDHLFDIVVTSASTSKIADMFLMAKSGLLPEYYTSSNEVQHLGLSVIREAVDNFEVMGNTPNPWNSETSVNFYLPRPGKVVIKVRDITGRLVYTNQDQFQKGNNSISISKDQLGVSGLLMYELAYENEVKVMKMLNIK